MRSLSFYGGSGSLAGGSASQRLKRLQVRRGRSCPPTPHQPAARAKTPSADPPDLHFLKSVFYSRGSDQGPWRVAGCVSGPNLGKGPQTSQTGPWLAPSACPDPHRCSKTWSRSGCGNRRLTRPWWGGPWGTPFLPPTPLPKQNVSKERGCGGPRWEG